MQAPSNTKSTTGGNTAGNEVETEGQGNNNGIKVQTQNNINKSNQNIDNIKNQ